MGTFYEDVTVGAGQNVQVTAAGGVVSRVVFFGSYNGGTTGGGAAFIEGDHRPGQSPGLVTFGGDVAYGGGARLTIEIAGTARGAQYDAIDVTGSVTLGGALEVRLLGGFEPDPAAVGPLLLIANDGTDAVVGAFAGLAEGSRFDVGAAGTRFEISYRGGDGNDVLTAVPEPAGLGLLGLAAAVGGYVWQRRSRATLAAL